MGQTFSRRVVRGLERGMDKYRHQMEEEAIQEVAAKQRLAKQKGINFSDPNALQSGFTRGEGPWILPNEVAQEEFLREQQRQQGGEKVELEPDLLKFLEEMGPVKKVVDQEFTSPRLFKHWKQQQHDLKQLEANDKDNLRTKVDNDDEEDDDEMEYGRQFEIDDGPRDAASSLQHPPTTTMTATTTSRNSNKLDRIPESERRTLQQMPLMENSNVTITRSTNFSTTVFAEDLTLGVTDLDLYGLLRKQERELQSQLSKQQPKRETATTTSDVTKVNPAAAYAAVAAAMTMRQSSNMTLVRNELVSNFTKQFYRNVGTTATDEINAEVDAKRQELLRKTMQVLELPAIMKDDDGYYFGVWPDRVDDLQVTSQLTPVPEYRIKLVLADITDTEKQRQNEEDQLQAPVQFSTRRRNRRQQDALE